MACSGCPQNWPIRKRSLVLVPNRTAGRAPSTKLYLRLLLLLVLQVLVTKVGEEATNQNETVQTDTEAGAVAARGRRAGGSRLSLGGRVTGLAEKLVVVFFPVWAIAFGPNLPGA